jgi:hypothetical protein
LLYKIRQGESGEVDVFVVVAKAFLGNKRLDGVGVGYFSWIYGTFEAILERPHAGRVGRNEE